MMISLTVVSLALVSFATAATTLDISAIEAHFQQALLVPSLLPSFTPSATLSVAFSGKAIAPGQALPQADVGTKPVVTVSAVDGTPLTGSFTIAMVDGDVVGTDESGGVNRHWLENAVTLDSDTVSNGTVITAYAGPGPASGSGPHRYVVLLYQQPSTFTAPEDLSTTVEGVHKFDLTAYVKDSGLGNLVAANYFTVEVGTDSSSLPATSAVVTSTLTSASAGASGGASSRAPGASASASAPAPSGSSPSTGGAMKFQLEVASVLVAMTMMVLLQ